MEASCYKGAAQHYEHKGIRFGVQNQLAHHFMIIRSDWGREAQRDGFGASHSPNSYTLTARRINSMLSCSVVKGTIKIASGLG
jgi:hypothetical protein